MAYEMAGVITSTESKPSPDHPYGVAIRPGDAFRIRLVFDPSVPDNRPDESVGHYGVGPAEPADPDDPEAGLSGQVGSIRFFPRVGGAHGSGAYGRGNIYVSEGSPGVWPDGLRFDGYVHTGTPSPFEIVQLAFHFEEPTGTAFTSDDLPLTLPPISAFATSRFSMQAYYIRDPPRDVRIFFARGDVLQLDALVIPETAPLLPMIAGGASLGLLRGRRRARHRTPSRIGVALGLALFTAVLSGPVPAWGGTDCNANGIDDATDIQSGFSRDLNANGKPDECEIAQVFVGTQGGRCGGGGQVFRFVGRCAGPSGWDYTWVPLTPDGLGPAPGASAVMDLTYYQGQLYAGVQRGYGCAGFLPVPGENEEPRAEVWRWAGGTTWIKVGLPEAFQ